MRAIRRSRHKGSPVPRRDSPRLALERSTTRAEQLPAWAEGSTKQQRAATTMRWPQLELKVAAASSEAGGEMREARDAPKPAPPREAAMRSKSLPSVAAEAEAPTPEY